MKKETRITLVASCAALLTIFLGAVNGRNDSGHVELLTAEIDLTREYIDLMISERLATLTPQDPELRLAKEEVIRDAESRLASILSGIERRNRSVASSMLALSLLQLVIILVATSADPPARTTVTMARLLLALALAIGTLALLQLWP